ncbi:MAG: restriction endonuclease subunit S [Candidatus Nitrosotenuis sp.]
MQIQSSKQGYQHVKSLFGKYEEIPEDWELKNMGSFLKITMGQSPPSESYNEEKIGLPFYQGVTDFGNIHPKPTIWCSNPKKIGKPNQILFSVRAPVGETNITESECCLGRGIAAIDPQENNLLYSYFLITYNKRRFSVYSQGTTYDAINKDDIAKTKLPFTKNKIEQQKIASTLSNVDLLIQQTQKIIEQTQRLKKSLMQNLLTRGIDHAKFDAVLLGPTFPKIIIPHEWKVEKLSRIAKVIDSRHYTPEYTREGIPLILPNNVKIEGLDLTDTKFTSKEDYLKLIDGNRNPEVNDIVYSRNATFGIACRVEKEQKFSLGQDLVLIKPEKINPYLLFLILNSNIVISQLSRLITGTTFKRINLDLIRQFLIPYSVDPNEQSKIAELIRKINVKIDIHRTNKSKLETLKKGLMQKLLTGQIRVKV